MAFNTDLDLVASIWRLESELAAERERSAELLAELDEVAELVSGLLNGMRSTAMQMLESIPTI